MKILIIIFLVSASSLFAQDRPIVPVTTGVAGGAGTGDRGGQPVTTGLAGGAGTGDRGNIPPSEPYAKNEIKNAEALKCKELLSDLKEFMEGIKKLQPKCAPTESPMINLDFYQFYEKLALRYIPTIEVNPEKDCCKVGDEKDKEYAECFINEDNSASLSMILYHPCFQAYNKSQGITGGIDQMISYFNVLIKAADEKQQKRIQESKK